MLRPTPRRPCLISSVTPCLIVISRFSRALPNAAGRLYRTETGPVGLILDHGGMSSGNGVGRGGDTVAFAKTGGYLESASAQDTDLAPGLFSNVDRTSFREAAGNAAGALPAYHRRAH